MADEREAFLDAMMAVLHGLQPNGEPLNLAAPPPGLVTVGDFLNLIMLGYGDEECPTPPA